MAAHGILPGHCGKQDGEPALQPGCGHCILSKAMAKRMGNSSNSLVLFPFSQSLFKDLVFYVHTHVILLLQPLECWGYRYHDVLGRLFFLSVFTEEMKMYSLCLILSFLILEDRVSK